MSSCPVRRVPLARKLTCLKSVCARLLAGVAMRFTVSLREVTLAFPRCLESQIQFHKTPLQINVIRLSFYVNVNRSNTRCLRWYFDVPVTSSRKIRNGGIVNRLRLGLIAACFRGHRATDDVFTSTSPSFMGASASRTVLKWCSLPQKPTALLTFVFPCTFLK